MTLIYEETLKGTDITLGIAMQLGDVHIAEMYKQLESSSECELTQAAVEALLKPWLTVL